MVLLIDNYDSFTYNLYQFLCELGADVRVVRNDAVTLDADLSIINSVRVLTILNSLTLGASTPTITFAGTNGFLRSSGGNVSIVGTGTIDLGTSSSRLEPLTASTTHGSLI